MCRARRGRGRREPAPRRRVENSIGCGAGAWGRLRPRARGGAGSARRGRPRWLVQCGEEGGLRCPAAGSRTPPAHRERGCWVPPQVPYTTGEGPPRTAPCGGCGGGGGRTHVCECPLELQTPLLRCPRGPAQPPPVAQLGTGHSSSRCSMLLVLQQHAGAAGAGGGSGPTRMSHGTAWHGGMQQLRGWEHRCPQTNHT